MINRQAIAPRCIHYLFSAFKCLLAVSVFVLPRCTRADFPTEVAPADVESAARENDCESILLDEPACGLLLIPRATRNNSDPKYHQRYHSACHVYITPRSDTIPATFSQRFLIYGADVSSKPLMIRVARLLAILWHEEYTRLNHDHTPDEPTVQVWLSERPGPGLSPDTAGEQFKSQIYIYDVQHNRRPIEWAREVAHEYGHYALPGISGFTAPEEWANGVLGERLYLRWIRKDIADGSLKPASLPFVTPEELADYTVRQVDPLINRVDLNQSLDLARRDAEGMDNYTALALYVDQFYGSAQLLRAMSYTLPGRPDALPEAQDFLRGFIQSAKAQDALTVTIDTGSDTSTHSLYLSAGTYTVQPPGRLHSCSGRSSGKSVPVSSPATIVIPRTGWYRIEKNRASASESPLVLTRRTETVPHG